MAGLTVRSAGSRPTVAVLVAAVALAGCGGGDDERMTVSTGAPPPASLPLEASRELVPLAARLFSDVSAGTGCTAQRTAASLRDATIRAINANLVQSRLQEELLGEVNALAESVPCRPAETSTAVSRRASRLVLRIDELARRGLARRRGPLDLRVRRAVVPADDPRVAVALLYVVPPEREQEATAGQRAVFTLGVLVDEVANGGFSQFFGNNPELADDVLASARELGVEPYTALVRRALAARDRPSRLAALDERMYELWEKPGLAPDQVFRAYVEANPEEFFVEPG